MGSTVGRTVAEADVFIYRRQNAALVQMATPWGVQHSLTLLSHYTALHTAARAPFLYLQHLMVCLWRLEFDNTALAVRIVFFFYWEFCYVFIIICGIAEGLTLVLGVC